jgi:hypothetical protein
MVTCTPGEAPGLVVADPQPKCFEDSPTGIVSFPRKTEEASSRLPREPRCWSTTWAANPKGPQGALACCQYELSSLLGLLRVAHLYVVAHSCVRMRRQGDASQHQRSGYHERSKYPSKPS